MAVVDGVRIEQAKNPGFTGNSGDFNRSVSASPSFGRWPQAEFRIEWIRGSGAGGQHRNKHANSARVTHLPTGLKETRQSRERDVNLREAIDALVARLDDRAKRAETASLDALRRAQIGSGARGDKIRTYREKDDRAVDERNGARTSYAHAMAGGFDAFWR